MSRSTKAALLVLALGTLFNTCHILGLRSGLGEVMRAMCNEHWMSQCKLEPFDE